MKHEIKFAKSGAGQILEIWHDNYTTSNSYLYMRISCTTHTKTSVGAFLSLDQVEELMLALAIELKEQGREFQIRRAN